MIARMAIYNEIMRVLRQYPDEEALPALSLAIANYLRTATLEDIENYSNAINTVLRSGGGMEGFELQR